MAEFNTDTASSVGSTTPSKGILPNNTPKKTPRPKPAANAIHSSHMRTSKRKPKANAGINGGRWTQKEHQDFLVGLTLYGREWKRVARHIRTRTSAQIRSHAQKYFAKLGKPHESSMKRYMTTTTLTSEILPTTKMEPSIVEDSDDEGYSSSNASTENAILTAPEAQRNKWKTKFIIRNSIASKAAAASKDDIPNETRAFIDCLSPVTKHRVMSLAEDELCAVHVLATYSVAN